MKVKRDPSRSRQAKARHRYWLTPRAWNRRCSHCGSRAAAAVRPVDHAYACEPCIERLGIKAQKSKAWRDGGSRAGSTVRVRFVDPESMRRAA